MTIGKMANVVAPFDTLSYARRLPEAGVPTQESEAHADAARQFIMAERVTRSDMEIVRQQFASGRTELAVPREEASANNRELRENIVTTQRELPQEIAAVRRDLRVEIAGTKRGPREQITTTERALREEIAGTKRDLQDSLLSLRREVTALMSSSGLRVTIRLGSVMAVGIDILAALIKP